MSEIERKNPTPEQYLALARFHDKHGRNWKQKLNIAWSNGTDANEPDGALLRQVRNQFGPEWLAKWNGEVKLDPPQPVKLTQQEKVVRAADLGRKAFFEGKKSVPAHDKDLMELMRGNKVGEGIAVLDAWANAWHRANLEDTIKVTVVAFHSDLPIEYKADGELHPDGHVVVTTSFFDGDVAFVPGGDDGISISGSHIIMPNGEEVDVVEIKPGLYVKESEEMTLKKLKNQIEDVVRNLDEVGDPIRRKADDVREKIRQVTAAQDAVRLAEPVPAIP